MNTPHRSDAMLGLIGHTPLLSLRFEPEGLTILAKAEFLNPSGSVKDRQIGRASCRERVLQVV